MDSPSLSDGAKWSQVDNTSAPRLFTDADNHLYPNKIRLQFPIALLNRPQVEGQPGQLVHLGYRLNLLLQINHQKIALT